MLRDVIKGLKNALMGVHVMTFSEKKQALKDAQLIAEITNAPIWNGTN